MTSLREKLKVNKLNLHENRFRKESASQTLSEEEEKRGPSSEANAERSNR